MKHADYHDRNNFTSIAIYKRHLPTSPNAMLICPQARPGRIAIEFNDLSTSRQWNEESQLRQVLKFASTFEFLA